MKCFVLLIILAAKPLLLHAQPAIAITEEKPFIDDGIEYGFSIRNVSIREVNNKNFSRYAVALYATNKSECSRVILFSGNLGREDNDIRMKELARFDCVNATGAKLTAKSGSVDAKPMFVTAKVNTRDEKGKLVTESQRVQIGYHLAVGETVSDNVIFIVPLNEKPEVKVRLTNRASVL
jgi:hypothetical protein